MLPVDQLLEAGGPVVWILSGFSLLATMIVGVKVWQLCRCGWNVDQQVNHALMLWQTGQYAHAVAHLNGDAKPAIVLIHCALQGLHAAQHEETLREELARRYATASDQLRVGLKPLELIGIISPLLGLLGTVFGMIVAFQQMESAGSQIDPALLSGGIWQALLTTAAGLVVAIPTVMAHNWLEQWVYRLNRQMQDGVTRVFTLALADSESRAHVGISKIDGAGDGSLGAPSGALASETSSVEPQHAA